MTKCFPNLYLLTFEEAAAALDLESTSALIQPMGKRKTTAVESIVHVMRAVNSLTSIVYMKLNGSKRYRKKIM